MKISWFGYGGNQWLVEQYRDAIQNAGHELITCHEYPNATMSYSKENINNFIDLADIVLLPHREAQPAKSVNKLAIAWSRGKACIVGERPAYLKYVKDKENAIIFNDEISLLNAIEYLSNFDIRAEIGNNGRITANEKLHPRMAINNFFTSYERSSRKPHVHVVIPHYAPRFDYIDLAVESVFKSNNIDVSVQVISSSEAGKPNFKIHDNLNVYHQHKRMSFSQAVNKGLKMAPPQTTHYLIFNDDAMLSVNALKTMVDTVGDREMILNPWSNCDKGWLHSDDLLLGPNKDLHPNMSIEEFTNEQLQQLMHYKPTNFTSDKYSGCNFCAFYCTLIPKSVLDKVGYLNENFSNGGEDADYSFRARKFGIESCWTREAFSFHFGGKTRKSTHDADPTAHMEEDFRNNSLLSKKWPKNNKKIAIWTGPAWEKWDLDSYTSGLGGSETCAGRLAETLASQGHYVTMYGLHDKKMQNGVELIPWDKFQPDQEYFDLFIASRNPNCIDERIKAKKILLWVHDIFALGTKQFSKIQTKKIDKFICLSPWHKTFFSKYHGVPLNKIDIIPNGVNVELFT